MMKAHGFYGMVAGAAMGLVGLMVAPTNTYAQDCDAAYQQCVAAAGAQACAGVRAACKDTKSGKTSKEAMSNKKLATDAASNSGGMIELGMEGKKKAADVEVKHVCDGVMTLTSEQISSKGVGVLASDACKLTLKNVTIKAKRGLVIEGSAQVRLEDSSIQASEIAISIQGNAQITLVGKSSISGKTHSVMAEDDSNVMLNMQRGVKVKGKMKLPATSLVNKNFEP